MGSNMMRQAVPLVKPAAPIVGTGMERTVAHKSGYLVIAEQDGEIIGVDANHITILYKGGEKKTYELHTFEKSNNDLAIHQNALVSK